MTWSFVRDDDTGRVETMLHQATWAVSDDGRRRFVEDVLYDPESERLRLLDPLKGLKGCLLTKPCLGHPG